MIETFPLERAAGAFDRMISGKAEYRSRWDDVSPPLWAELEKCCAAARETGGRFRAQARPYGATVHALPANEPSVRLSKYLKEFLVWF